MGLLDSITGMFGGSDKSANALLDQVKKMVASGGLDGLLEKFNAAGLGDKVKSWVGSGPNDELTGDEVEQALGADQVKSFAADAGVDEGTAKEGLAKFIPEFVNKLTPDGNIPGLDQMKGMLDKIPGIGGLFR